MKRKILFILLILCFASFASALVDPLTGVTCTTDPDDYNLYNDSGVLNYAPPFTINIIEDLPSSGADYTIFIENHRFSARNQGAPYWKIYGTSLEMIRLFAHFSETELWYDWSGDAGVDLNISSAINTDSNITWHLDRNTDKYNVTVSDGFDTDNELERTFLNDQAVAYFTLISAAGGEHNITGIYSWNGTECPTGTPPPPIEDYFQINAENDYNGTSINIINLYYLNGTLINFTTNGTLKTSFNDTLENFTIESTETGGYFNLSYTNYNTSNDLTVNMTLLFYVFESQYMDYKNFSNINYSRNLSYSFNYSCPDFAAANLELYFNSTLNKSITLTCNNQSTLFNDSFIYFEEGVFTTGLIFNTSLEPIENNKKTGNATFTSDLNPPSQPTLTLNFSDGFFQPVGNISLRCTDSVFPSPYYNLSFAGVQLYYDNLTSGTTKSELVNMTSGTNTVTGICEDLFRNSNDTFSRYVYVRNIILIDEVNNSDFEVSNLTNVRAFFDDNSSSWDFKANGSAQVSFISAATNKIRFELEYFNGDIITRYIDVSLSNGDLRVCANIDPTTHYEQLIVSATQRRVSLKNVFSNCVIAEDYTRFVYQDSFILRALTRDSMYYLYSYDSNGNKIYLASLDGSLSSYYNLDTLEFNIEGYNLDITGNSLTFERIDNYTLKIFFKNLKNDSIRTNITITNANTSYVYFSILEEDDPNEFYMLFNFATLGLDEKQVLKITLSTENTAGEITEVIRYFNLSGRTGFLSSAICFVVGVLLTIFGLSLTAARSSLGWFGLMIIAGSIGVMAFGVMTWYIILMMAIDVIIGAFIGIIIFSNSGQIGVT